MKIKEYFEPYLAYIKARGRYDKTIVEHRRFLYGAILKAVGDKEVSELRKVDGALVEDAGKMHGRYGSLRSVVTLRRLLNYIEDRGDEVPFSWRTLELPKVPKCEVEAMDEEELNTVMDSFDTSTTIGLRTRVLFEFLFTAGLRISEALNIKRTDINLEKREVKIINAKTKDPEVVYLTDRCLYWLSMYLNKRTDIYEYIFTTHNGRLTPGSARRNLQKFTKHLKIDKHMKPHLFRKTFTTLLLKNNVNIKHVQHLARHKSERTTLRYYVAVKKEDAKVDHQRVMKKICPFDADKTVLYNTTLINKPYELQTA